MKLNSDSTYRWKSICEWPTKFCHAPRLSFCVSFSALRTCMRMKNKSSCNRFHMVAAVLLAPFCRRLSSWARVRRDSRKCPCRAPRRALSEIFEHYAVASTRRRTPPPPSLPRTKISRRPPPHSVPGRARPHLLSRRSRRHRPSRLRRCPRPRTRHRRTWACRDPRRPPGVQFSKTSFGQ